MKKIIICLAIILIFGFTGCKYEMQDKNSANTSSQKLSEKEISDMESTSGIAAGFYMYDKNDQLIRNTEALNLVHGELNCYLEFMNVCKKNISFTLLVLVNNELQKFSVNGMEESYSYDKEVLRNRETDKINIVLHPSVRKVKCKNRISFLMIYNNADYKAEDALVACTQEEHVLNIDGDMEKHDSSFSDDVTYVKDVKSIDDIQYKLSISTKMDVENYDLKKNLIAESDKLYFRLLATPGKYAAFVLIDGKITKCFDGDWSKKWKQKKGFVSLFQADLGIPDANKHKLVFLFYNAMEQESNYNVSPIMVVSTAK